MIKALKIFIFSFSVFSLTAVTDMAFADVVFADVKADYDQIEDQLSYSNLPGGREDRDHGRDRDRDWGRRRNRPVACYAESRSGRVYLATGYIPRRVQQRAMDLCFSRNRLCRALGCRSY